MNDITAVLPTGVATWPPRPTISTWGPVTAIGPHKPPWFIEGTDRFIPAPPTDRSTPMLITREFLAALREGDVVVLTFPSGSTVRGPLTSGEHYGPGLGIADAGWSIRDRNGDPGWGVSKPGLTIEVVSHAPRPFYTNVASTVRAEPFAGDVCRDADEGRNTNFWMYCEDGTWASSAGVWCGRSEMPKNLLLILDGETGEPPA